MAGYPTFKELRENVRQAQEAGATAIELGIPFSDPVADGPTIQGALHRALGQGVTPRRVLEFVRGLRRDGFELPILGMTYANLLFAAGYAETARLWADAGIDGAIVPDVPLEEASGLRSALRSQGLGTVSFVSPGTSRERLERSMRAGDSFAYLVAVYGTTGARADVAPETRELVARARRARNRSGPPLCVGFGVSRPQHVAKLREFGADGVIVGSALVPLVERRADLRPYLRSLVRAASG